MAYKKIKAADAPKRRRLSVSRFEKTEDWQLMKADLDKGLKPNEALEIILTDEDKKRYRLEHRRTVTRFIKKYLQTHKLPYTLKSFGRDSGDYFLVMYVPKRS
jgi:hypothetical protein